MRSEDEARDWIARRWGSEATEKIAQFLELLALENRRQNLVSTSSLDHAWLRHIVDSAQLLTHCPSNLQKPWLDIGTGAGFPGLVVALLQPDVFVHLVEPRGRRAEWLAHVATELALTNVAILQSKIDAVDPFDAGAISARAVASLVKLVAWGKPFSTNQTVWLLPKGRSALQELESVPNAIQKMFHVEQSITDKDAAILVGHGKA